jgi:hypothetical protein
MSEAKESIVFIAALSRSGGLLRSMERFEKEDMVVLIDCR